MFCNSSFLRKRMPIYIDDEEAASRLRDPQTFNDKVGVTKHNRK